MYLQGLIQICIITFGEQPPVFAKPATSQPQMTQVMEDHSAINLETVCGIFAVVSNI